MRTFESRKVDPVHFFDARGNSVLSMELQKKDFEAINKENEMLRRKVRVLEAKVRMMTLLR